MRQNPMALIITIDDLKSCRSLSAAVDALLFVKSVQLPSTSIMMSQYKEEAR